jgi:L-asparaginase
LQEARVTFEYEVVPLFRKDSLEITAEEREQIVTTVKDSTARHIIVTHGTDTMVETAEQLLPVTNKVVVLTGSLAPARFKISDAEFNLGMAIAAVQSLPTGVYVSMNGRVFRAGRVRKNLDDNRFEEIAE